MFYPLEDKKEGKVDLTGDDWNKTTPEKIKEGKRKGEEVSTA